MSAMIIRRDSRKGERGQVLILCAICLVVLLLFIGLAIDFGMAYVTKASLGKSVDAAALTGARYSAQGVAQGTTLAQSAFAMNYGTGPFGLDTVPPVVNIAYSTDASGDTLVSASATATIKTFFIGILPGYSTLNVASSAQSIANRVVMTLVLDRTGSMLNDGGSTYLAGAVTDFIGYFNNTSDTVAVISFANDVKVDVPMTTGNFQQAVINDASGLQYQGATWSDGALQQALLTESGFAAPPGARFQKVVVFFTDGNANTLQDTVSCTGRGNVPSGIWNMGGDDSGAWVGFVTTSNASVRPPNYPITSNPEYVYCAQTSNNCCGGTFNSHVAGGPTAINWTTVSGPNGDARYRALVDANNLRAAGITVYSVGLGTATEAVDPSFLCNIANDPTCATTYNPAQPAGVSAYADTAEQLDQAFQTVATTIRLRLTQ